MSKDTLRSNIAQIRKNIISLQENAAMQRNSKKARVTSIANSIRSASTPTTKASLRQSKITAMSQYDNVLASIKGQIDAHRIKIANLREQISKLRK